MPTDPLREQFAAPPASYRGAPFWSWNDRLQVDELARQVRDMRAHGMGGFFMHSREGLETPYLGEEWMECIRETVKTAKETGSQAWLYDEDRWPSGFAGGRVTARGDAFRAKRLVIEERQDLPAADADGLIAVFAATFAPPAGAMARALSGLRRLDGQGGLNPGEVCLAFRRVIVPPSEWFNDDAYADNLNPDSVKAFIEITYEAYKQEVGGEFGKTVPGIFTDEPNIMSSHLPKEQRALPWTDGLLEFFRARRGWDLRDGMPWLFFPAADPAGEAQAARARHDYWWTISERFTQAYSKQLGEWCDRNNLSFTGHFLNEQEMGTGILAGGAIMPHYRYQHVPGIDMLTEQNYEFLTIKQCTSVAAQWGRKRVLSETYGCSGWEFTFEGQKWNGDWQYVLGVNLRCQHLALYSLRGCRKRDYPPAFNYNTTWWKYNAVVEDYFARVGLLTSAGRPVRDVLVLHPVATGWSQLGEGLADVERVNAYADRLNTFVKAFLATHYDFDFGDEQLMATSARLLGGELAVGQMLYPLVVIPPETRTLLPSTVELLAGHLSEGGRVIAFSPLPDQVRAAPDSRLGQLWQQPGVTILPGVEALQAALEALLPRRISLITPLGQQAAGLLYMQRKLEDGRTAYFIVNNLRNQSVDVKVMLEGRGRLEEWDALSGEIRAVATEERAEQIFFNASFGPAGSKLYVIDPEAEPLRLQPAEPRFSRHAATGRGSERAVYIGPACAFQRTDPNLLTLDTCRFRLNGGEWSAEMDVWRAQQQVREKLGMRQVFYNGLPQRYRWALAPHPADGARVELRFAFGVNAVPEKPVDLLVEGARWFRVALNGQEVKDQPSGWYLDHAFERVPLPACRVGMNELWLTVDAYTNAMELEDCYLLGEFGVSPERQIGAEPASLHFGDWTSQGYLHYAGGMIYLAGLDYDPSTRAQLVLGEVRAIDVAVHVNGAVAGHIPWASANGFDLTPHLRPGHNDLGIEVVASPRNMLGPLHRATGRESWTDWRSFRRVDATYTPGYVVQPWGLVGQAKVVMEEK